jgi:8-oxo-dGTP diphosphatase
MENQKPKIGVGIMILRDNKVLLGRRHDDPEKASSELHGESTWTMPGGKLDFGETLRDAAQREVMEEIGVNINKDNLKLISLTDNILPDVHFVTVGFIYENLEQEPKVMEPDEIVEWKWFDLGDLPKPIYLPSEQVLKNYLSKKIY